MNSDEFQLDVVDRLARIETHVASVVTLDVRVDKLEKDMSFSQGMYKVIASAVGTLAALFGGHWYYKG